MSKFKLNIEAPVSLGGLFPDSDEESDNTKFEQTFDIQSITIVDKKFDVRQYSWHMANANKVWPGAFNLAEFIYQNSSKYTSNPILELGSATGILAMYLKSCDFDITTSDIEDEGDVEENVKFNFSANSITPVMHIPYTWGNAWPIHLVPASKFKYIIASDILLYVSAYSNLVKTISYLFDQGCEEFLMSWNRRINESAIFFDMMQSSGFVVRHHGHCIYSFFTSHSERIAIYASVSNCIKKDDSCIAEIVGTDL